jgi:hypothetical protein
VADEHIPGLSAKNAALGLLGVLPDGDVGGWVFLR